jgi:hypothetical protein
MAALQTFLARKTSAAERKRLKERERLAKLKKRKKRKKKRKPAKPPQPPAAVHTTSAASPTATPPAPQTPPRPPIDPGPAKPPPIIRRDLGRPDLKRLLWRAGFGPTPGQIDALAGRSPQDVVYSLTRVSGAATLSGPEPHDDSGMPLAPQDAWGHDHVWWLDRMVRSDQQLVERMTLIWHDWFATSNEGAGQKLMLDQNEVFRRHALGSFKDLLTDVTQDPAMLLWLSGTYNTKWNPNENYARELMELFTLGADRGAYTETDVRELAKALTGFRNNWTNELGPYNFRYDDAWHDHTVKSVFGKSGDFNWRDACRMVLEHPAHPSFFVTKLWGYFIPTPPDEATQAALQALYLQSGYGIRPVVEAILLHPDFYDGPRIVKPPVVYNAGLLRGAGRTIDTDSWGWRSRLAGQQLFYPPSVAGWDHSAWLSTSTWRARWTMYSFLMNGRTTDPWNVPYDTTEDPETALVAALNALGNPALTDASYASLLAFARTALPGEMKSWQQGPFRAMRQNALRQLIATSPDFQTS